MSRRGLLVGFMLAGVLASRGTVHAANGGAATESEAVSAALESQSAEAATPVAPESDSRAGVPWLVPAAAGGNAWLEADYLLWWINGSDAPPLVTASPDGTPIQQAGVIGAPGTTVIAGDGALTDPLQMGFQLRGGIWLDDCHCRGLETSFLWIGGDSESNVYGSPDGSSIVTRPFIDAQSGLNNSQLVSFPGVVGGTTTVAADAPELWGYDILGRKQLSGCRQVSDCCGWSDWCQWDFLTGYRHYEYSDQVSIAEDLVLLDPTLVPGTSITLNDSFAARTRFDGMVLGVSGERMRRRHFLQGAVKLNVGQVTRDVTIDGETTVTVPGDVPSTGEGGLYALSSNMGHHRNSQWTVLPEFQAKLGYQVTRCWTAYAGYNLLVWPHVARAVEQIDPVVNTDLLPPPLIPTNGPARPTFSDPTSTLWVQGLTLGVTGRF